MNKNFFLSPDNEATSSGSPIDETMLKIERLGTPQKYIDIYRDKINDIAHENADILNERLMHIYAVEENIRKTEKHQLGNSGTPAKNIEKYTEIARNIFIDKDCTREGANKSIGTLDLIVKTEDNIKSIMEGLTHAGLPEDRAQNYAEEMRNMVTGEVEAAGEIKDYLNAIHQAEHIVIAGTKGLRKIGVLDEDDLNNYTNEMRSVIDNADKYDDSMVNAVKEESRKMINNKEYAIDTQKEESEHLFYGTAEKAIKAIKEFLGIAPENTQDSQSPDVAAGGPASPLMLSRK